MKVLSGKIRWDMVLEAILDPNVTHITCEGHRVKVTSTRLMTFATKGLNCVTCGREGSYFEVNDNTSGPHLNLYSTDGVLMTKDHIIPKSKGGSNGLCNMQTMCRRCNAKKGNGDPKVRPSHAIAGIVDDHMAKYGNDSPIKKALVGRLRKAWEVKEYRGICDNSDLILDKCSSMRSRCKMRKYVFKNYSHIPFVKEAMEEATRYKEGLCS